MPAILVVDDDATARDLLSTVLGYAGHEVREAQDGVEALASVSDRPPDLIIVDLLMPTMNGLEFVAKLRENPATAAIPVVFYTASYLESEAQNLAEVCGVAHIITKPAEPERIFAVVNAALGRKDAPSPAAAEPAAQHGLLAKLTAALSQKAAHVVPRLEAMIALGLRLASERDPERLLADFCAASGKIIGARYATVSIRHDGEDTLRYSFTSGVPPNLIDPSERHQVETAIHQDVLATRSPRRLSGLPGDPTLVGLPSQHPPVHSFLCAPILSPQRVYGWLSLSERIGMTEFSDEDEALAQILSAQVGRIYENGSLYREVKLYAERLEAEIVERKQAQEETRALNADLERRIERRTAQLVEVNAELEAFGYTVSHDLRAPLRAFSGYSSLLLETEAEHLSENGRRYLQAIVASAQRMSRMVNDLLAFSRLGRHALTIVPVDMNALVREVWTELIEQDGAPARFDLEDLPAVAADHAMLRQVWSNLVSNALKYSSKNPDRCIAIRGSSAPNEVHYFIRDNGVGFDSAHADKLFRVFERLHSPHDFEGTGAGLAIVDRIIRRHGGRIWAESQTDMGATFHFAMPRNLPLEPDGR